jgi:hypothetical protein
LDDAKAVNPREILLVYDKECPLCDAYRRMVRIRESVGTLRLVKLDIRQCAHCHVGRMVVIGPITAQPARAPPRPPPP